MAEIDRGFTTFFQQIIDKADGARAVAEHVIDSEVETFVNAVELKIPETDRHIPDKGGLKRAFRIVKVPDRQGWYGYDISFEGNTSRGDSWEKVANIINSGTITRAGTGFLDKPKRALKGMTKRIEARIRAEFDDIK